MVSCPCFYKSYSMIPLFTSCFEEPQDTDKQRFLDQIPRLKSVSLFFIVRAWPSFNDAFPQRSGEAFVIERYALWSESPSLSTMVYSVVFAALNPPFLPTASIDHVRATEPSQ